MLIESSKPCPDLTEAFHNPTVLRGTDFLSLTEQFNISPGGRQNVRPRRAILIKTGVSKYWVSLVLAVLVLSAIGIGVIAGFWGHSVTVGLVTCAGLAGILALVQAFLLGMKFLG